RTGVARQHRGYVQCSGEAFRDLRCTDVIGDVPFELLGRQPQGAVAWRDSVAGMVTEQDQAGVRTTFQDAVAVVLLSADAARPRCVMSHGRTIVVRPCHAKRLSSSWLASGQCFP